jgi:hypothetical protein
MDRFIAEGVLPGFARLRRESMVFKTDAEEDPPELEPWIQWVTVHTGKAYAEHKVFELSDGPQYKGDRIWDLVSDAGAPVWICGSMNSAVRDGKINGMVLPDPWAVGVDPYPSGAFDAYFRFVSTYVKEYSAQTVPLSLGDHLKFMWFMATHGLSPRTVLATLSQLATERKSDRKWARAFILDNMQFDLFKHFYRKLKPRFSTIFLNSTAHFQHFHWRNLEPELFDIKPSAQDQAAHQDAVRDGYIEMDKFVRMTLDMADAETTIVFATALSQQPLLKHEADGGKILFKAHDNDRLIRMAGITTHPRQDQVMSNQFYLVFDSEDQAKDAAARLSSLRLSTGEMAIDARLIGSKISVVCNIYQIPDAAVTVSSPHSNEVFAFSELFYPIHGMRSGYHHRDGMFWVRTPRRRHAEVARTLSLREIAPTLMALCGLEPPKGAFDLPAIAELAPTQTAVPASAEMSLA